MTAQGKITTSEIGRRPKGSVRILITDDSLGLAATANAGEGSVWHPARNKTGMVVATVLDVEAARGNRRTRYDLVTDRGTVANLSGSQTFWLAPEAPAEPVAAVYGHTDDDPAGPISVRGFGPNNLVYEVDDAVEVYGDPDGRHPTGTVTFRVIPTSDPWHHSYKILTADGQTVYGGPMTMRPIQRADEPADRITVKQLRYTQGVRVLLAERYSTHAGGGAGPWTAARTAPPRGGLYVAGEPADVHAATVTEVRRVTDPGEPGAPRYDVVTNLGTVERVTAGQVFRLAPANVRDTAEVRAGLATDREQREQRTAGYMADLQRQIVERDAQAEHDRAQARQFLAEIAPEPASSEPSDRVRIERHRGSVTQGEVSVVLDGELLGRYGDQVGICTTGSNGRDPHTHADGAVCFGGFHGLPDAHWYQVANRVAARRALVEPVHIAAARTGVEFHALAGVGMTRTVCNQDIRTGQIRERAAVVTEHGAVPCPSCYPDAAPAAELAEYEAATASTSGAPFASGWASV